VELSKLPESHNSSLQSIKELHIDSLYCRSLGLQKRLESHPKNRFAGQI